jgi:hypothetical protein
MYCSNLSFKFYPQTQKKLVGFSHYGHFRDKLINSDKNDCPCDLTYLEDWLRENSIDITSLRVHTALLEESKSPIGTIIAWVPKVQQNKSSVIELPLGN